MKDVHRWLQPLLITPLRLIELLDVLSKHGDNAVGRIARFEPASQRVREKILLRAPFIHFQGNMKFSLEVGHGINARHKGEVRN